MRKNNDVMHHFYFDPYALINVHPVSVKYTYSQIPMLSYLLPLQTADIFFIGECTFLLKLNILEIKNIFTKINNFYEKLSLLNFYSSNTLELPNKTPQIFLYLHLKTRV